MPVDVKTQKSKRFRDFSPLIALGALGLIACAGFASGLLQKTLFTRSLNLSPEESITVGPIQLKKSIIGALRIDVSAVIPTNHWITYEIALVDAEGNLLASAMKQAWRESGTWREDGESGTWEEQDLQGGLDIRSGKAEQINIELSVLEYGTTSGEALDSSATLEIVIKNGVVDTRYLMVGSITTLLLTGFSFYSVYTSGKYVIKKSIGDSDLGGRGVTGGADNLIKAIVAVTSDEKSPSKFTVDFSIKNKNGEEIYFHQFSLNRSGFQTNDSYRQSLKTFFLLEPRDSYRFYVEVVPDGPVDRTRLTVQEGAHTILEPDIIHIQG